MKSLITDFADLAKRANLRALDGRPQDEVTAGVVKRCAKHDLPNCHVCRIEAEEPAEGWAVYWQNGLYGAQTVFMDEDVIFRAGDVAIVSVCDTAPSELAFGFVADEDGA